MPSFWSHLAKRRVSLGWVVRIRGISTLFASFPCPTTPLYFPPLVSVGQTLDIDGDAVNLPDATYSTLADLVAALQALFAISWGTDYQIEVVDDVASIFADRGAAPPSTVTITITAALAAALGFPVGFDLDTPSGRVDASMVQFSRWLRYGSETYSWHECISADEIAGVSTEIDPWTGAPVAGETSIGFRLTPTIRALLDAEFSAATKCVLTGDASQASVAFDVDDETTMPASGYAHLSAECVHYDTVSPASLDDVTRGLFGSRACPYFASLANVLEFGTGGPYISTRPMRLKDRLVDVWAVPMFLVDGIRSPFGDFVEDGDNARIALGPLIDFRPDHGTGLAQLGVGNLAKLIDAEVMTRFPTASAGHGLAGYVQIDADSCRIAWAIDYGGVRAVSDHQLERDDGTGTTELVPTGLWSIAKVGQWIGWTIDQWTPTDHPTLSALIDGVTGQAGVWDGVTVLRLHAAFTDYHDAPDLSFALLPGDASLWPELGFASGEQVSGVVSVGGVFTDAISTTVYTAPSAPPMFRLSTSGLRRLYYRDRGEVAFDASPGWTDASSASVNGFVRVAEELIEFSSIGTARPDGIAALQAIPYLTIARRGALGSQAAELVTKADDEAEELRQVAAFPRTEWGRAFLYLACSGFGASGGYDQAWRGSGAALAEALFDDDSFELLGQAIRDVVVTEAMSLRDVLAALLPQTQTAVLSETTLRLVDLDPITEDEVDYAETVAETDCVWVPSWDDGEDRIVNRVNGKNLAYDPGTDKGQDLPIGQGTSAGTWGYQDAVDVDCRWSGNYGYGRHVLEQAFDRLVAKFGSRFATIGADLVNAVKAWAIAPADPIALSHSCLPDGLGGLGLVSRLCRVWGVSRTYQSSGGARGRLTLVAHDLDRSAGRCRWAPSAKGVVWPAAVITIDPDEYSAGAMADQSNFDAGMLIRVSTPCTTTHAHCTIASVVGAVITCTGAVGIAGTVIVEHEEWSIATAAQRRLAYLADATHGVGTDPAKKWS
jgi:hypothetical protein